MKDSADQKVYLICQCILYCVFTICLALVIEHWIDKHYESKECQEINNESPDKETQP